MESACQQNGCRRHHSIQKHTVPPDLTCPRRTSMELSSKTVRNTSLRKMLALQTGLQAATALPHLHRFCSSKSAQGQLLKHIMGLSYKYQRNTGVHRQRRKTNSSNSRNSWQ